MFERRNGEALAAVFVFVLTALRIWGRRGGGGRGEEEGLGVGSFNMTSSTGAKYKVYFVLQSYFLLSLTHEILVQFSLISKHLGFYCALQKKKVCVYDFIIQTLFHAIYY